MILLFGIETETHHVEFMIIFRCGLKIFAKAEHYCSLISLLGTLYLFIIFNDKMYLRRISRGLYK